MQYLPDSRFSKKHQLDATARLRGICARGFRHGTDDAQEAMKSNRIVKTGANNKPINCR